MCLGVLLNTVIVFPFGEFYGEVAFLLLLHIFFFIKRLCFFENIVVVTIGTSCCLNGFFLFKISSVDNKKEAAHNGLPLFPREISLEKKNNDYF